MIYVKRWNRCLWMLIVASLFLITAIALIIPGAIAVSTGANQFNDTLLYVGLAAAVFGGILLGWWLLCQYEVGNDEEEAYDKNMSKRKMDSFDAKNSRSIKTAKFEGPDKVQLLSPNKS